MGAPPPPPPGIRPSARAEDALRPSAPRVPAGPAALPRLGRSDLDRRIRAIAAGKLRELRLGACLSQAEVSRRTGIHRPIVSRMERGTHTVSLASAKRFAQACGARLRDVLQAVDEGLAGAKS